MGRHSTPLPSERRLGGAILGGAVVVVLVGALWGVGSAAPPEDQMPADTTTSIPTTTSAPPTTSPTTVSTTVTTRPSTTQPPPTDPPTTQPVTTETTIPPLTLEGDGLGVIDLGADVDETRNAITARLGSATSDSGWVNARGTFGTCPGSVVRVIRWGSLRVFFGDGPTGFGDGNYHFYFFSQSRAETDTVIDLRSARGIGVGSTVADLVEAYGDDVEITSSSGFGVTFIIEDDGTSEGLLSGTLTESIDTGQVTSLTGGFGCGA